MSNNYSHSSLKNEANKTPLGGLKKSSEKTINFSIEKPDADYGDYTKMNVISFKRSFFKLQKNYSTGKK